MSNWDRVCRKCGHGWHGLTCMAVARTCGCPTAWEDPNVTDEYADLRASETSGGPTTAA